MPEDAPALQSAEDFLAERGIESLANAQVKDHQGNMVPLAEAISMCDPARHAIDANIATIKDMAGADADILPAMTRFVERMGETDPSLQSAPSTEGAGKK